MNLPIYISMIGDKAAAKLFDTPLRTVQAWRRRVRYPKRSTAVELVAKSGGKVTMGGIYSGMKIMHRPGRKKLLPK